MKAIRFVLVDDDDAPCACRHCPRFVRYVMGRWLDADDEPDCRPGLYHEPMPDHADLRLAVAEALHPEDFR